MLNKPHNLRSLLVVIEREASLPPVLLLDLIKLTITCDNEDDWPRLFHEATFGKSESVTFYPRSKQIGDFLGAFERAALSSSLQNMLSKFRHSTPYPWNPGCSSLVPFTQMVDLDIKSSYNDGCSSRVDDDIVINLLRAMLKLKILGLDDDPCHQFTTGVTAKGFVASVLRCPDLYVLRMQFQMDSFNAPPTSPEMTPDAGSAASWADCALTEFAAEERPMPEGSAVTIGLTLLRIFPRIDSI